MRPAPVLPLLAALAPAARAQLYTLADAYVGASFLSTWSWQTIADPTHGAVNYVDLATAVAHNLTYATPDKFVMRADSTRVVANGTRGRDSVRILSDRAYADSLLVLDLQHMPQGCATWSAFWSLSQTGPWPAGGEIDVIEGVNLQTGNLMSLHTSPNCTMPAPGPARTMTGTATSTICDADHADNEGCGVAGPALSYAADFNAAGGGWFAVQRGPTTGIRAWFWSRQDAAAAAVPAAVRFPLVAAAAGLTPDGDAAWGEPYAVFPTGAACGYAEHFDAHQFVFDLTFCGDWAGNAYPSSGCPGTCTDLVNNHPEAFTEAYWEVNGLYIYTPLEEPPTGPYPPYPSS
ncbi:glycoside hydrolase family 16 protein [Daedalea quercina L-15889]|uniref:Glycoside hydrolase family 16 protein n=1 Tax=Daedalea quercina L-15889 TaxID=1314783 RepID=A0A165N1T6_9APHY|nr:glycoside hydrolase family 16 protein [Daedalea quercina L-15889]